MEKYLGNKSSLLPLIETFINQKAPTARSISDVFCGTGNTSRYFKGRGWRTASNDANRFSYVLCRAYLGITDKPQYTNIITNTHSAFIKKRIIDEFRRTISRFGATYTPHDTQDSLVDFLDCAANALSYLQQIGEENQQPGIVTEYFTRSGSKSAFVSSRGSSGFRNYFSRENALIIDGILSKLRHWHQVRQVSDDELFIALAAVIEEVVNVANVSGTFHDFNRAKLWPNAMKKFQLRLPQVSANRSAAEITNCDATSAAGCFDYSDVAYLDPPYNFRQYSAYYHFLNFIAAFPFLDDLQSYAEGLTFVRGQNPRDDFNSSFSSKRTFIPSLRALLEKSNSTHVVLSYFSGRNHWNHWADVSELTDEGLRVISELFSDRAIFDSCEIVPVLDIRQNYQSRSGEKKAFVNEYLFYGKKSQNLAAPRNSLDILKSNASWSLDSAFSHYRLESTLEKKSSA